jgi:PEP-CTERM motif
MHVKKLLIALAATAAMSSASALTVFNTAGTGLAGNGNGGNQNWNQMMGVDFTVTAPKIFVTALGVFNDDRNGITTNVRVALVDITGGTFNSIVAGGPTGINMNGATGTGSFLFSTLGSPVALTQGRTYSVQTLGFNSTDQNFNQNSGGAGIVPNAITFNGGGWLSYASQRADGGSFGLGTIRSGALRFGAGSLQVAQIPEPGALALAFLGLGMLGFAASRRKA